jgi:hypothetical protein
MPVPKTPVNEDDGPVTGQDDVGTAGQLGRMKTKSKSELMQQASDAQFRLGVPALHSRHIRAPRGGSQPIHVSASNGKSH